MNRIILQLCSLLGCFNLHAAILEKSIPYSHGDVKLEGYHAYDDALKGKRPAVLIIHQWTGLGDHEKRRAKMLAELGYNVFAADIYGAGIRPTAPAAGEEAGKYKSDRTLFRNRMLAGLEVLKQDSHTDPSKIAAVGYCFGGLGVIELARAGTDIAGVVSFHGSLASAPGMSAGKGKISAKILCLHGASDPHVQAAEVNAFQLEMSSAKADWQFVSFGGAVHAFTQESAGDDISKGVAYDKSADMRSWEDMQQFFAEIFDES
ncbi:MAG: dienelactone hydrolase family protein [Armatimonadetes bacterium]|nr:dienelactone hydrolase family protein [Akkermansiaceae bacterium]